MLCISLQARLSFSTHFVQKTQNISFFYTYRCCGFFEADEGAGAGLDLLDPEVSFQLVLKTFHVVLKAGVQVWVAVLHFHWEYPHQLGGLMYSWDFQVLNHQCTNGWCLSHH